MRKKRTYIILLLLVFAFSAILFLVFGLDNIKKGKLATTIVVGDDTVWTYSNKNWLNVRENTSIKKLDWKKFDIYINNKKLGNYYLWRDSNKWFAFDDKKNAVVLDGEILAFNSNYDVKVREFTQEDIIDRTYVNYVLEENNLGISSQTTSEYKVSFDFDSDGINEDFYVISNVFAMDFEPDESFSIVFMVKDNMIYYLYNDISKNKTFNGCMPYITSFLDVNEDNEYEIILSCARYSVSGTIRMLYQYDKDAFKIVISNE